jgi:hypothetical protein
MGRMGPKARVVFAVFLMAVGTMAGAQQTVVFSTEVLESFDATSERQWLVRGSKFISSGFPQQQSVAAWPAALFGREASPDLRALGIHGRFDRKGYNYLEIFPVRDGPDGIESAPIAIPGQVQRINVWVWGSNFNYYLEAHLRDYRGVDYTLPLGGLRFAGWRNLSVNVPGYIPQQQPYIPKGKALVLTKLVMWTRPGERVDDFYLYVDHLNVLTDVFVQRFDGDGLSDPETTANIWNQQGQ